MNLQKAISLEKEYINLLLNKEAKNAFNLTEKLQSLGYSQKEYILARDMFYLHDLNVEIHML